MNCSNSSSPPVRLPGSSPDPGSAWWSEPWSAGMSWVRMRERGNGVRHNGQSGSFPAGGQPRSVTSTLMQQKKFATARQPGILPTCVHEECPCRVRVEVECHCDDGGQAYRCTCGAEMVAVEESAGAG